MSRVSPNAVLAKCESPCLYGFQPRTHDLIAFCEGVFSKCRNVRVHHFTLTPLRQITLAAAGGIGDPIRLARD